MQGIENDPAREGGRTGDPTPTGDLWEPKGALEHLKGALDDLRNGGSK